MNDITIKPAFLKLKKSPQFKLYFSDKSLRLIIELQFSDFTHLSFSTQRRLNVGFSLLILWITFIDRKEIPTKENSLFILYSSEIRT